MGEVIGEGKITDTFVEYQHKVWATNVMPSFDPAQKVNVTIPTVLPLQSSPDPAAAFQNAMKDGDVKVIGHRKLDERDAILLSVNPNARPANKPKGRHNPGTKVLAGHPLAGGGGDRNFRAMQAVRDRRPQFGQAPPEANSHEWLSPPPSSNRCVSQRQTYPAHVVICQVF